MPRHRVPGAPDTAARPALVAVSLLAVYLAWGPTYLAIRVALTAMPPFLLAGLRSVVAATILLLWHRGRGHARASRQSIANAALIGVFIVFGGNGLLTYAEQWVSSGLAASIVASGSIWLVLILAILGERPSRVEVGGIVLGFTGVLLINLDGQLRASPAGAAALLLATVSWAVGSVLTRRLVLPGGALAVAIQLYSGGILMIGIGLATGERIDVSRLTAEAVSAWLYLVVAGSVIGFTAFHYLMQNVRPALATSFIYVNPVIAVLLGVAVGGETVTPLAGVGIAVSVVALVAVTSGRSRSLGRPRATR